MSAHADSPSETTGERRAFCTTHWDLIQLAGQRDSPQSMEALESLCRAYWAPLCSYVRHLGYTEHEAQDLTQGYFARLLEKNTLASLTLGKGRFRSFLIASLKNYLANEWDRAQRVKRGGGVSILPLGGDQAGDQPLDEPMDPRTPERIFDRHWAEQLVAEALRKLESEFSRKEDRFDQLKAFLIEDKGAISYATVAARLHLNEQAVKSAVHRMRQRYRELFRAEVGRTVGSPAEIDEEMRYLFAALSD